MEPSDDPVSAHWRLDRRVPVAVVLVLVGQFAAGIAAFTKVQSDVSFIREHVTDLRDRVSTLNQKSNEIEALKVELRFIGENVRRLRGTVDRIVEDRFANRRSIEERNREGNQ